MLSTSPWPRGQPSPMSPSGSNQHGHPALCHGLHAFSLVELLTVMAIISMLLVAAVPIFSNSDNSARQSSRELIKAHLQQARAHAIATGNPTAVVIPILTSGEKYGARGLNLFEVEKDGGSYIVRRDDTGADLPPLQRWEFLPGNFHFLTSSQFSGSRQTIMDSPDVISTSFNGNPIDTRSIIFAPNGQIIRPSSEVNIAIAQASHRGNNLTFTEKSGGRPIHDLLQINRLTGRNRSIESK